MFASKSLVEHLARGIVGIGAVTAFVLIGATHPVLSFALLPVALIALRGCPMCWTMGLVETAVATRKGPHSPRTCLDGSCARPTRGTVETAVQASQAKVATRG